MRSWRPLSEPLTAWRWWAGVGWLGVAGVLVLSLAPLQAPPLPGDFDDKLAHVLCYGLLAYWFGQLYRGRWQVAVGLMALGAGIEVVQGLLAFRSADALDLLADAIGIGIGLWLAAGRLGGLLARLDRSLFQASR